MGRKKSRFYKDEPKKKDIVDTNVEVVDPSVLPTTKSNTSSEVKVEPTPPTKLSKRKAKQLEKYLAKKLKIDQRPALIEQLQQFTCKTDALQSTKSLLVPSRRDTAPANSKAAEEANREASKDHQDSEDSDDGDHSDHSEATTTLRRTPVLRVVPELALDLNKAIADIKRSGLNPFSSDDEEEVDDDAEDDTGDVAEQKRPNHDTKEDDINLPPQLPPPCLLPPPSTYFVLVERSAEIMEQRAKLPIFAEEQRIMECIQHHPVVIICGETGSGKTTQVPQFLYEAGFGDKASPNPGLIGVTQPRRVAAVSMAKRVGEELGAIAGKSVAYQIRYESTIDQDATRIKFMTDGILLREISEDFLLQKYSVLLLDEAHERNLNTDILIGMLSRAVRMRNQLALSQPDTYRPLRLVIMSATLNVDEFANARLFDPIPPVIKVDARQHPVTIHFARTTDANHVEAAFKIIRKIHANLPPGGILVFMTGKQEITTLARKLNKKYSKVSKKWKEDEDVISDIDSDADTDGFDDVDADSSDDGREDAAFTGDEFAMGAQTREPLYVLPLYSLLAPEEQLKVFQPPPDGHRLCVLATNVAETSLTIPNIRYVVDSGLVKQRLYDPDTGAQEFDITWCSKASAVQRAGRAGRVGPGHCYRLYSSPIFEVQFPEFSVPEIQRTPIEGLVLQLRAMGIDRPERFPLPSSPEETAIIAAQKNLLRLNALAFVGHDQEDGSQVIKITRLGRLMSRLPLAPMWSRLLVVSLEMGEYVAFAVALAAAASLGDPFTDGQRDGEDTPDIDRDDQKHSLSAAKLELAGRPPTSDIILWMSTLIQYMKTTRSERRAFCLRHHLMPKRMDEMHQQFQLLTKIASKIYPNLQAELRKPLLKAPIKSERDALSKLLAESLSDRVAERVFLGSNIPIKRLPFPAYRLAGRAADDWSAIVFLHPTSVLSKMPPSHLVYGELCITEGGAKYIKQATAIDPAWIADA